MMRGVHIVPSTSRGCELLTFIGLLCTEQHKAKFRLMCSEIFQQQISLCLLDAQTFLTDQFL